MISHEINRALSLFLPIVALETTVVTHGLPRPQNLSLARDMESTVREEGAVPATIGVLEGKVRIGMSEADLDELANDPEPRKISQRDFAIASVNAENGGTTVAETKFAAHQAGWRLLTIPSTSTRRAPISHARSNMPTIIRLRQATLTTHPAASDSVPARRNLYSHPIRPEVSCPPAPRGSP